MPPKNRKHLTKKASIKEKTPIVELAPFFHLDIPRLKGV